MSDPRPIASNKKCTVCNYLTPITVPSRELEKGPTVPEHVGVCVIAEQTWGSVREHDCWLGNQHPPQTSVFLIVSRYLYGSFNYTYYHPDGRSQALDVFCILQRTWSRDELNKYLLMGWRKKTKQKNP